MPELPEVETISNDLNNCLKGDCVVSVSFLDDRFKLLVTEKAIANIINRPFIDIFRRAKMVVFDFGNYKMLVHLKMTGQLIFKAKDKIIAGGHPINNPNLELPNKHTRIIFHLKSGNQLYFNDIRKFGWLKVVSHDDYLKLESKLGLEPLNSEFTKKVFASILSHSKNSSLKKALLDQKYLVGLGNIYVDEVLFMTQLKPTRLVKTLEDCEISLLHLNIIKILKTAIKARGTTFNNYTDASGTKGNFSELLKVYGRGNLACLQCGQKLEKIKLAGRGTVYCDFCQK